MTQLYKKNFVFHVERYEIWQNGYRISRENISTNITSKVIGDSVFLIIEPIEDLEVEKISMFTLDESSSLIMPGVIEYINPSSEYKSTIPTACYVYYTDNNIDGVRYEMMNSERQIDFYGKMIQSEQNARNKFIEDVQSKDVSAESILNELQNLNSLTVESIMERAVKILKDNSGTSKTEFLMVVECLKLLLKSLDIDKAESANKISLNRPKIYLYLALCNYRLLNKSTAYCAARQGLDLIKKAIKDSTLFIPPSMLAADALQETIDILLKDGFDDTKYKFSYPEENIIYIDTKKIEDAFGFSLRERKLYGPKSEDFIFSLIQKIDTIYTNLMEESNKRNDYGLLTEAECLRNFAYPVFYAWEFYGYGKITDFWRDSVVLTYYLDFKNNDLENLKKQYKDISSGISPLEYIEEGDSLAKKMLRILDALINDIENYKLPF